MDLWWTASRDGALLDGRALMALAAARQAASPTAQAQARLPAPAPGGARVSRHGAFAGQVAAAFAGEKTR